MVAAVGLCSLLCAVYCSFSACGLVGWWSGRRWSPWAGPIVYVYEWEYEWEYVYEWEYE